MLSVLSAQPLGQPQCPSPVGRRQSPLRPRSSLESDDFSPALGFGASSRGVGEAQSSLWFLVRCLRRWEVRSPSVRHAFLSLIGGAGPVRITCYYLLKKLSLLQREKSRIIMIGNLENREHYKAPPLPAPRPAAAHSEARPTDASTVSTLLPFRYVLGASFQALVQQALKWLPPVQSRLPSSLSVLLICCTFQPPGLPLPHQGRSKQHHKDNLSFSAISSGGRPRRGTAAL